MHATISPPTREAPALTQANVSAVPLPPTISEGPAQARFNRDRARQRFTAIAATTALVLSLVTVTRTAESTAAADETAGDELVEQSQVENTKVPTPSEGVYGQWDFRGGSGLSGVSAHEGVGVARGTYWVREPGGSLRGDAVADGRLLYISSPDYDLVYRIDLTTGSVDKTLPAKGRVNVSAAIGRLAPALGDTPIPMTIYVDERGTVYGRATVGTAAWSVALDEPVTAAPVMADGEAVVVTQAGRVYGFNADGPTWIFPEDGTTEPITVSPAYQNGTWYIADDGGTVHLIDNVGGSSCERRIGLPPIGNPVVEDGIVYIQSIGLLATFPAGRCGGELRVTQSATDTAQPVAVHDNVVFSTDGRLLFPFRPATVTVDGVESPQDFEVWVGPFVAGSDITTPPVVAEGLIYIGTRDGLVFAIEESSGEQQWSFDANLATASDIAIQGSIVVLDGAVIVTTSGGHVIAIAGETPASAPEYSTRDSLR